MHKTKIDYLRGHFPKENCFSAITKVELDYMTVGTPVMINMKPFVPNTGSQGPAVYTSPSFGRISSQPCITAPESQPQSPRDARDTHGYYKANNASNYKGDHRTSKQKTESVKEEDVKKTNVGDLYKMGVVEANKILQNRRSKVDVMFIFSFYKAYKDYYAYTMQTYQVYFDGKIPLIYNEGHRFELERLSDIYKKGDLNNFAEMTADSLKENRYINYNFGGINSSNKKYMFEDINIIFASLKKMFPENFSFFESTLNDGSLRSLVDTISISFYRMQDIIAIFDSKKTSGMGVEIFLTNSAHKPIDISKSETVATYRFLFSKSRENIFTIDGDLIKRQYNTTTNDMLGIAFSVINKNIPINDERKKPSRRSICAE